MAATKLTSLQAELRSSLLQRFAQRIDNSTRCEPERLPEFGLLAVPRSQRKATSAKSAKPLVKPLVLFRTQVHVVSPEEKQRFYAASRNPKNKDRKDYPIVELL